MGLVRFISGLKLAFDVKKNVEERGFYYLEKIDSIHDEFYKSFFRKLIVCISSEAHDLFNISQDDNVVDDDVSTKYFKLMAMHHVLIYSTEHEADGQRCFDDMIKFVFEFSNEDVKLQKMLGNIYKENASEFIMMYTKLFIQAVLDGKEYSPTEFARYSSFFIDSYNYFINSYSSFIPSSTEVTV